MREKVAILISICVAIFIFSIIYLLKVNSGTLNDTVTIGGDTLDYQAIGVNLLSGHGYKNSCIEDFATYKIDKNLDEIASLNKHFVAGKHGYYFYRAPGYPFFIAFVYKIFGIHPIAVKIIQIIMLAIVASLLPAIGAYYWPRLGYLAGIISSLLFIKYFHPVPTILMTESLVTFTLCVLVIFIILWENKPSLTRTFILGVLSAVTILLKGLNIFIPALLLIYVIVYSRKKAIEFLLPFIFIFGFLLSMAPWCIYASNKSEKFIFLSTQADHALLDFNNEDIIMHKARWSPAWRKNNMHDQRYLYNRLENRGISPFGKYIIFMRDNWQSMPKLFINKAYDALTYKHLYIIVLCMLGYYLTLRMKPSERVPVFPGIFFINITLIILIFGWYHRFALPFIPFISLPAAYLPLKITEALNMSINERKNHAHAAK